MSKPTIEERVQRLNREAVALLENDPEFLRLHVVIVHLRRACDKATPEELSGGLARQLERAEYRWQIHWKSVLTKHYAEKNKIKTDPTIHLFTLEEKSNGQSG